MNYVSNKDSELHLQQQQRSPLIDSTGTFETTRNSTATIALAGLTDSNKDTSNSPIGCSIDSSYNVGIKPDQFSPQTFLDSNNPYQDHNDYCFLSFIASKSNQDGLNSPNPHTHLNQDSDGSGNQDQKDSRPKKRRRRRGMVQDIAQKVYRCAVSRCGRVFLTAGHLGRHVKSHSGERPFSCPIGFCTSRFSRKDNMVHHYRVHLKRLQNFDINAGDSSEKLALQTQNQSVMPLPLNAIYYTNAQLYPQSQIRLTQDQLGMPQVKSCVATTQQQQNNQPHMNLNSSDTSSYPMGIPNITTNCVQCVSSPHGIKGIGPAIISKNLNEAQRTCLPTPDYSCDQLTLNLQQTSFGREPRTNPVSSLAVDLHHNRPCIYTIESQCQKMSHTYTHIDPVSCAPSHHCGIDQVSQTNTPGVSFPIINQQKCISLCCSPPSHNTTDSLSFPHLGGVSTNNNIPPNSHHMYHNASSIIGNRPRSQCAAPECSNTMTNHSDSLSENPLAPHTSPTVCCTAEYRYPCTSVAQNTLALATQDVVAPQSHVSCEYNRASEQSAMNNNPNPQSTQSTFINIQQAHDDCLNQNDQGIAIADSGTVTNSSSIMRNGAEVNSNAIIGDGSVMSNNSILGNTGLMKNNIISGEGGSNRRNSCCGTQIADKMLLNDKKQISTPVNNDLMKLPACCTDISTTSSTVSTGCVGRIDLAPESHASKKNSNDNMDNIYGGNSTPSQILGPNLSRDYSIPALECCPERCKTTTNPSSTGPTHHHRESFALSSPSSLLSRAATPQNTVSSALYDDPTSTQFSALSTLNLKPEDYDTTEFTFSKEGSSHCGDYNDRECQFLNCSEENRLGFISSTPEINGFDCSTAAPRFFRYSTFLEQGCHLLSHDVASIPNQHAI